MRLPSLLVVALLAFVLTSGAIAQQQSLGDWTISGRDLSVVSRSVQTHVTIEVDASVSAPTLSITAVGPFPVPQVGRGLISQNGNRIEVLDWNAQPTPTSSSPRMLASGPLLLFSVAVLLLASGARTSRSSSSLGLAILAIIALSVVFAETEGPHVQIRLRVPPGVDFGSLSFDLASGSIVNSADTTFSVDFLTINLCKSEHVTSWATLDALTVVGTAEICATGNVQFTNFWQRGPTVSTSLTSVNGSISASSTSFAGSFAFTGSNGVTISGNGACTTTAQSPSSHSGKCSDGSTHSFIASAATTVKFDIYPGCPANFARDGPMPDTVPPSPPVTPATSAKWDFTTTTSLFAMSNNGRIASAPLTDAAGINITLTASLRNFFWLNPRQRTFVTTAGQAITVKTSLMFEKAPAAISNLTFVLVDPVYFDRGEPPLRNGSAFPQGQSDVLAYHLVNGPFTTGTGDISVNLVPSRSLLNAWALVRIAWEPIAHRNVWYSSVHSFSVEQAVVAPTSLVNGVSELVTDHRMPPALDSNPRSPSDCPHLADGLLDWHDASIWPGGTIPNPSGTISIPAGKSVLISSCSLLHNTVYHRIHVPTTSRLIFADANINVRVRNIWVEGQLHMGSPTCRLNGKINIEFVGDKTLNDNIAPDYGSKGIGVSGSIDIHGKQYHPTWTRLAATIVPGADTIYVLDSNNWEVGQSIVIATNVYRDADRDENEVRVIKAIDQNGRRLQLDSPLDFYHYAGAEYQIEVGLLSRRIVLKGDDASEASEFGGHTRVMGEGRFSGVQTYRMGQKNMLGKYPFHFHMMGPAPTSYVKDCSIWNSFFRCIAIHATNDTHALRNVAFNTTAHCYYLEDGVEENNVLNYNLAVRVNVIGQPMGGGTQAGEVRIESPDLILPADAAAGGFYITNAYNTFIGNAASGGWAGFSFPNLPESPIGLSRHVNMIPERRPLLAFVGNTAHSSGYHFGGGGCIYVGGSLRYDRTNPNLLHYNNGRFARNTRTDSMEPSWMQYNDTKTWLCNIGLSHWGQRAEVVGYESYESGRSVQIFGESQFSHALVSAHTNSLAKYGASQLGFGFYDTWVKSIVTDVEFRGFVASDPPYNPSSDDRPFYWPDRRVLGNLIHSDEFKPQGISATARLKFTNTDRSQLIAHKSIETGSARYYNFVDWDGSVGGTPGVPQIIGDARDWWKYDPACVVEPSWNSQRCPQGTRTIANVHYIIPGVMQAGAPETSDNHIGQTYLFGPGIPAGRNATLTKNPGVTGVTDIGWYFHHYDGTPKEFHAHPYVIPLGHWLLAAWKYPVGTTFDIKFIRRFRLPLETPVPQVNSMAELMSGDGLKYYFDGNHLYIKMIIPDLAIAARNFTRAGVTLYTIENTVYYHVQATCPGVSGVWCPSTYQHPTKTW